MVWWCLHFSWFSSFWRFQIWSNLVDELYLACFTNVKNPYSWSVYLDIMWFIVVLTIKPSRICLFLQPSHCWRFIATIALVEIPRAFISDNFFSLNTLDQILFFFWFAFLYLLVHLGMINNFCLIVWHSFVVNLSVLEYAITYSLLKVCCIRCSDSPF